MQITILGLALVPLTLIWAMNPVRLLQLAFVAAVFEAGAAAIIGSFGLPTAMVPGLLFIVFVIAQYALGMRYPAEGPVFWALTPLLALLAYALLSVVVLPDAFAGTHHGVAAEKRSVAARFRAARLQCGQCHPAALSGDERCRRHHRPPCS